MIPFYASVKFIDPTAYSICSFNIFLPGADRIESLILSVFWLHCPDGIFLSSIERSGVITGSAITGYMPKMLSPFALNGKFGLQRHVLSGFLNGNDMKLFGNKTNHFWGGYCSFSLQLIWPDSLRVTADNSNIK